METAAKARRMTVPDPARSGAGSHVTKSSGVGPIAPGEEVGGEVGGRLAWTVWRRRHRTRARIGGDYLAVEMPGGMAEHGDDYGKAEEGRNRAQRQQDGHDQAPGRHRHRVLRDDAQR